MFPQDFLVEELAGPDFFAAMPNNNTLSSVLAVDENGNLLHRFEQFNFFDVFTFGMGADLQLSSATSQAFALGPGGRQLHPFAYQTGQ